MGLSATQRFLVEADRAAGTGDLFRCSAVGDALGYTPAQADGAARALGERKLVILLHGGEARLLAAGRRSAAELAARHGGPRDRQ